MVGGVGDQLGEERRLHLHPYPPGGSQHGRLELIRGHGEDVENARGQERAEVRVLKRPIVEVRPQR